MHRAGAKPMTNGRRDAARGRLCPAMSVETTNGTFVDLEGALEHISCFGGAARASPDVFFLSSPFPRVPSTGACLWHALGAMGRATRHEVCCFVHVVWSRLGGCHRKLRVARRGCR